jgi:hypothetical protein
MPSDRRIGVELIVRSISLPSLIPAGSLCSKLCIPASIVALPLDLTA